MNARIDDGGKRVFDRTKPTGRVIFTGATPGVEALVATIWVLGWGFLAALVIL